MKVLNCRIRGAQAAGLLVSAARRNNLFPKFAIASRYRQQASGLRSPEQNCLRKVVDAPNGADGDLGNDRSRKRMNTCITSTVVLCAVLSCFVVTPIVALESADDIPDNVNVAVQRAVQHRDFSRAIQLFAPYTTRGNNEAEFGVAALYILRAYVLRSEKPQSLDITKNEKLALDWLRRAAAHGNHKAADLYHNVQHRGTKALYFISIEHLLTPL